MLSLGTFKDMNGSPTENPSPTPPDFRPGRVRPFAVLLGFLLGIPVAYAVTNQVPSNIFSLMVAPVAALFGAVVMNIPLRRFVPKFALTQSDLIIVFAVVSVVASVGGEWARMVMAGALGLPLYEKSDPTYHNYLLKYLPNWLAVHDYNQVRDVQGGGKDFIYAFHKFQIFLPTIAGAGLVILMVCFGMTCLNSLMRGAWCERERLTFPIIQLPIAMTENGGAGPMWRSKAMWIAFFVMFGIDILNGFNYLYPNIPAIPVKDLFYIDRAFKDPPLSNMGDVRMSIYPFMAAIGLFMPSDLLFSFVAFFFLRKITHVVLAANGIPQSTFSGTAAVPGPPYFDEQTWGAVLAMFLGALWVSRSYLKEVWSDIRTGRRQPDGGITHQWAFIGFCGSVLGLVAMGVAGGLPIWYMVPYVLLFFIFSAVLTRIRAQLGPPTHEFAFFGPNSITARYLGTTWMSDAQATWLMQVFIVMNRMFRNHPMPYQLEAMKMAHDFRINQKRMFQIIVGATVAGFFLVGLFYVVWAYRVGTIGQTEAPGYIRNLVAGRKGPDVTGIGMTMLGFTIVMCLDLIRFRFPGFPLHPAGYVLSLNYGVDYYWFGLLLALFTKNFVQRYFGLSGYDKLRMVALGILMGEYAAETIWMGVALMTHQSTYTISFNERSLGVQ